MIRRKNSKFLFGCWTSFPFSPFPSISRCLTHSFSGDVSTETESMHRWRQKFLADNQSSSFPAFSEDFVTFYFDKIIWSHKPCVFWSLHENQYPFPSGLLSWITRCAHNAGTGGSRIRPLGNCAKLSPRIEVNTINTLMLLITIKLRITKLIPRPSRLKLFAVIWMKIENQLTKTVNYYTLIYREVGLLQHNRVGSRRGKYEREDKQHRKKTYQAEERNV